jgi:NitT/TauT family transport system ATP-binding protein
MEGSDINQDPYIKVSNLHVDYGTGTPAIAGLDLTVAEGEFIAIVGPSGCGKSTLLHCMSGLLYPSSGTVEIEGRRLHGSRDQFPRIGYVFQEHRLLPWRSVSQNIELVLSAAGIPKREWEDRVTKYLDMLQIGKFRESWPLRLSGGQRQRASIARALAVDPAVVLMDEPFSTLDEVTARAMRQEVLRVWEVSETTIVFVTHSIREAIFLSDRVILLTRGPARVLDELPVSVPRPREYEDPHLTELEARIVQQVMEVWGYESSEGTTASRPGITSASKGRRR